MPICYLDRDGVLNHHLPYVGTIERFIWFDEIFEIILKLKKYNYKFIIVTNQSGIARGYYSIENFYEINEIINSKFNQFGINIDIRYCPHLPEEGCNCRKPKTGMISCDSRSRKDIFIGDQISDMECAFKGGVNNRWLLNQEIKSEYETRSAENHQILINKFDYWYSEDIR